MRTALKLVFSALIAACSLQSLNAQDLAPRAYIITPVHWNAVTLTYSFSDGDVTTNNAIPVTDATGTLHVTGLSYFHSLRFFGRSANILASLPYGVVHYQGTFQDNETKVYRSGLLDSVFRFSVNLKGGPAMSVKEYQAWKQKTILGVSLKVVVHSDCANTLRSHSDFLKRLANTTVKDLANKRISGRDQHLVFLAEMIELKTGRRHYRELAELADAVRSIYDSNYKADHTADSIRKLVDRYGPLDFESAWELEERNTNNSSAE